MVVPKVEGVVEPVADTGLGDVGLFGEVEEKADVVLKRNGRQMDAFTATVHGYRLKETETYRYTIFVCPYLSHT